MSKWVHNRVFGRGRGAAAFACLLGLASASTAHAAESSWPTAQAVAAHAEWVPYLDPPPKPAAICLVDSGINITPDTPADSPEGPILERTALDGGSGEDSPDPNQQHGTYMAMTAGAPMNDWGTVGIWPGVRIYSIRARPTGQTTFPFDDYRRAISQCRLNASNYNIVAVNLSLGCNCIDSAEARARLDNTVADAHNVDVSVVASAGNDSSGLDSPADQPGVFSVAAGATTTGALCSFSNRGPDVDVKAPGCDLDGADPAAGTPFADWSGGTSAAAAQASTALALLRSYRPSLGWQDAEQLVNHAARLDIDGPNLDIEALFREAGLAALVNTARARSPQITAPVPPGGEAPNGAGTSTTNPLPSHGDMGRPTLDARANSGRFPAPQLASILHAKQSVTVSVRNRPRRARLVVLLQRRRGEFGYSTAARAMRTADTVSVRVPRGWRGGRVVLRFQDPEQSKNTSPVFYRAVRR